MITDNVPKCTCCVCGKVVNKRQTLFIGKGRSCREHAEVGDYLDEQMTKRLEKKADDNLKVIMIVSFIRVQSFINPLFLKEYYLRKVFGTYGEEVHGRVVKELDEKGPLTDGEIQESISAYVALLAK